MAGGCYDRDVSVSTHSYRLFKYLSAYSVAITLKVLSTTYVHADRPVKLLYRRLIKSYYLVLHCPTGLVLRFAPKYLQMENKKCYLSNAINEV